MKLVQTFKPDQSLFCKSLSRLDENSAVFSRDQEFFAFLPPTLRPKINSVLAACTVSAVCHYYIFNNFRPDQDGRVIDEHPFIAIKDKQNKDFRFGFVEHGSWTNRTSYMPERFRSDYLRLGANAPWPMPFIDISENSICPINTLNGHHMNVIETSMRLMNAEILA